MYRPLNMLHVATPPGKRHAANGCALLPQFIEAQCIRFSIAGRAEQDIIKPR